MTAPGSERQYIIIGSMESPVIKNLFKAKKMDKKALAGKNEKYIIQVVEQPQDGIDRALVIAGSDKRGTIYGIYELSEQMQRNFRWMPELVRLLRVYEKKQNRYKTFEDYYPRVISFFIDHAKEENKRFDAVK